MKRLFYLSIMVFSVFVAEAFSKEWNGIVPGFSTRPDVEKILGKAKYTMEVAIYRLKKAGVTIHYERKDNKDVVIWIKVYPDKDETLSHYIKKIPNFHKSFVKTELDDKITHVRGLAYYHNFAEGFEIVVQKNDEGKEVITTFGYFAPVPTSASNSFSEGNQKTVSKTPLYATI